MPRLLKEKRREKKKDVSRFEGKKVVIYSENGSFLVF